MKRFPFFLLFIFSWQVFVSFAAISMERTIDFQPQFISKEAVNLFKQAIFGERKKRLKVFIVSYKDTDESVHELSKKLIVLKVKNIKEQIQKIRDQSDENDFNLVILPEGLVNGLYVRGKYFYPFTPEEYKAVCEEFRQLSKPNLMISFNSLYTKPLKEGKAKKYYQALKDYIDTILPLIPAKERDREIESIQEHSMGILKAVEKLEKAEKGIDEKAQQRQDFEEEINDLTAKLTAEKKKLFSWCSSTKKNLTKKLTHKTEEAQKCETELGSLQRSKKEKIERLKRVELLFNKTNIFWDGKRVLSYLKMTHYNELEKVEGEKIKDTAYIPGTKTQYTKTKGKPADAKLMGLLNLIFGLDICRDHGVGILKQCRKGSQPLIYVVQSSDIGFDEDNAPKDYTGIIVHADRNMLQYENSSPDVRLAINGKAASIASGRKTISEVASHKIHDSRYPQDVMGIPAFTFYTYKFDVSDSIRGVLHKRSTLVDALTTAFKKIEDLYPKEENDHEEDVIQEQEITTSKIPDGRKKKLLIKDVQE